MTRTLADVDVQALDVPGLTFRIQRKPDHARIMLVCSDGRAATELWMTDLSALPQNVQSIPSLAEAGGVELHSPTPFDPDDRPATCDLLDAPCYSGGVSLIGLPFPSLVRAGESADVLRLLAARHEAAFGGDPR